MIWLRNSVGVSSYFALKSWLKVVMREKPEAAAMSAMVMVESRSSRQACLRRHSRMKSGSDL